MLRCIAGVLEVKKLRLEVKELRLLAQLQPMLMQYDLATGPPCVLATWFGTHDWWWLLLCMLVINTLLRQSTVSFACVIVSGVYAQEMAARAQAAADAEEKASTEAALLRQEAAQLKAQVCVCCLGIAMTLGFRT